MLIVLNIHTDHTKPMDTRRLLKVMHMFIIWIVVDGIMGVSTCQSHSNVYLKCAILCISIPQ